MAPTSYRGPLVTDVRKGEPREPSVERAVGVRDQPTVTTILGRSQATEFGIAPDDSIHHLVDRMNALRAGALVVVDATATMVGIVTERDVIRGLRRWGLDLFNRPVAEIMTRDVVTCSPRDGVDEVARRMTKGSFRHMPVMDHGRAVGLLSVLDVLKERLSEVEYENMKMKESLVG